MNSTVLNVRLATLRRGSPLRKALMAVVVAGSLFTAAAVDTWYVDADNGNDAWNGKADFEHADATNNVGPKKTLGVFTQLVRAGDTIYAAKGRYNEGTSPTAPNFRFYTAVGSISLIATGGMDETVIEGKIDTTVSQSAIPYGCGTNSVVPVKMLGENNLIRGFTIANGRQTNYVNNASWYGGGVIMTRTGRMIDCVVTNCTAVRGGGVYNVGYALRCRFTGNFADEGAHALYLINAVNCVFENTEGYAVYNNEVSSKFVNCTCRGNKVGNFRAGTGAQVDVYNSVFTKVSSYNDAPKNKRCMFYNCLFDYNPTYQPLTAEAIIGTNGECRVVATGTRLLNDDGTPLRNGEVADRAVSSYYDDNYPSVFDATEKSYDVRGKARTVGVAMDLGAIERQADDIDYNDWFVDDENGNDANSGKTPALAFKTLARASTNASMTAVSTIYVAEGTYDSGVVPANWNGLLPQDNATDSRMYIWASGISFVATGRREATIIVGASSSETASGVGPGAVRCCLMRGGTIRGFTLTGGNVTTNAYHTDSDTGGGIFSTSDYSYAIDCEIHHCNAVRGGGARGVALVRCYLHDNTCDITGVSPKPSAELTDAYMCRGYNSFLTGPCYRGNDFINCTILGACWGPGARFVNCYVGKDGSAGSNLSAAFTNCVCATAFKDFTPHVDCVENGPCGFSTAGRPVRHGGLLANKGDNALYESLFLSALADEKGKDLAGGERILEGIIDIGAGEAIWIPSGLMFFVR